MAAGQQAGILFSSDFLVLLQKEGTSCGRTSCGSYIQTRHGVRYNIILKDLQYINRRKNDCASANAQHAQMQPKIVSKPAEDKAGGIFLFFFWGGFG